MCKNLSFDDSNIISLSNIYAIYGVFDGEPILAEDISKIKKSSLAKSCTKLVNKVAYKPLQIQEKACTLCRYSPNFKNARLKDEMIILRRLLEPSLPFLHCIILPSDTFMSLYRMSSDYAIGDYPIIPLNCYLYNFLAMNDKERYNKHDLINHFTHYLIMNDTSVANHFSNINDLIVLITTYINDIYRIPLDNVSEDKFQKSQAVFLDSYTYEPSIYEATSIKINNQTNENSLPSNKIGENDLNNNKAVIISNNTIKKSLSNSQSILSSNEFELDQNSSEDDYKSSRDITEPILEKTIIEDEPFIDIINERVSESTVQQIAAIQTSNTDYSDKDASAYCKRCIENEEQKEILSCYKEKLKYAKCKLDTCFYSSDRYCIAKDFSSNVTIFDRESSTSFMSDMIHSYFIGLELSIMDNRKGILIYCSYNWRYYFYDIELVGIEPLNFHFSDTGKIFSSFHSFDVLGYINKFGICNGKIHDFQVMYCLNNNTKNIPMYQILYDTTLLSINYEQDFYQTAMRYYKDLYEKLYGEINKNDSLLLAYNRTLRLYNILSKTYDLSDILEINTPGIELVNYNKFKFEFNWSQRIKKLGIAYRIIFDNEYISTQIDSDSLIMDICLLFKNLPHSHRIRSRLLSISNHELITFYEGSETESRRFYDLLISGIRASYSRRYNDILSTETYSVLFSSVNNN